MCVGGLVGWGCGVWDVGCGMWDGWVRVMRLWRGVGAILWWVARLIFCRRRTRAAARVIGCAIYKGCRGCVV